MILLDVWLHVDLRDRVSAPSLGPSRGELPRNLQPNLLKHTNSDELRQWGRCGVYAAPVFQLALSSSRWPEHTDSSLPVQHASLSGSSPFLGSNPRSINSKSSAFPEQERIVCVARESR